MNALRASFATPLLAALLLNGACGFNGRNVTAPTAEYGAYRRFRLADRLGARLVAAHDYLRDHKGGLYEDEVRAWFVPAEAKFFAAAGATAGGAAAYLTLMPDGPHAAEERAFLEAYEKEKLEGPARAKAALEEARKKAEASRRALGEAVETWTKRAAKIEAWRTDAASFDSKDPEFSVPFYGQPPKPACNADGCSKHFTYTYPIPDVQTASDRTAVLEVRVEITIGVVTGVSLRLPKGGFNWWLEGTENRQVDPTDEATRTEAFMRAKNRVEKVIREVRGGTCTTKEEPEARTIECGSLRVNVGTAANGDDFVSLVDVKPT